MARNEFQSICKYQRRRFYGSGPLNDKQTIILRGTSDRRRQTCPARSCLCCGRRRLGSYQAGVYQALHEAGIEPDWIIGTSIGAINASLIAGNGRAPFVEAENSGNGWSKSDREFSRCASRGLTRGFPTVDDHQGDPGFSGQICSPMPAIPFRLARKMQLTIRPAASEDAYRTCQFNLMDLCTPRLTVGAAHPNQPDALFRQPRQDFGEAHHGVRRAGAGLSGSAHRR